MTWYVYLLECADGTLYCGVTTQPQRRLAQHNGDTAGGARYTRSRRPVVFHAIAPCPDHSTALKLEARIRRLPRTHKVNALAERVTLDSAQWEQPLSTQKPSGIC